MPGLLRCVARTAVVAACNGGRNRVSGAERRAAWGAEERQQYQESTAPAGTRPCPLRRQPRHRGHDRAADELG